MLSSALHTVNPLAQASPDAATAIIVLIILLLLLVAVSLSPGADRSVLKATNPRQRALQLNRQLAELSRTPTSIKLTSARLQSTLLHFFELEAIHFGPVEGDDWHLSLCFHRNGEQHKDRVSPPCPLLPFKLNELTKGDPLQWTSTSAKGEHERLAVPLMADTELIGVLALHSQAGQFFDEAAIDLLSTFTPAASAALQLAVLEEEVEDRATQLVLLGEISRRLISLRPLEERWLEIAPLLSQAFEFSQVQIFELESGQPELKARSHQTEQAAPGPSERVPTETVLQVVRTQAMVATNSPAARELAVPLAVKDRLLGVLHLTRDEGPRFSQEEISLAEIFAAQMAIAVLEAQNYAQQQEYTWYNTVMLEVTRHAAQPGDSAAAMRAVLQLTTMLAGANWAMLLLPDEQGQALRAGPSSGLSHATDNRLSALDLDPRAFELQPPYQESEQPYILELPDSLSQPLGQDKCLAMTLSDGRNLLGLLLIGDPAATGPRRSLLAGIGHQLSMRIENTRLIDDLATRRSLERELETARNIQQSFMPLSLPQPVDWQVGATWMAARQVGGDFFDFIPLPASETGSRWGVVIADVADKGVPAALFMALCRTLLRSIAAGAEDPAQALDRLNKLILSDTHAELFVSLFYGVWEPETGWLAYANGGHNPPVLFSEPGQIHNLRGTGMVLGVSDKARYRNQEIQLAAGDILVLYTDGVTEAMNSDGVFFGQERLIELMAKIHNQSAQGIAEQVRDSVIEFSARDDPPDDMTTVVLKRLR